MPIQVAQVVQTHTQIQVAQVLLTDMQIQVAQVVLTDANTGNLGSASTRQYK